MKQDTDLLSHRFDLSLLGLSGLFNVFRGEAGNHCVVERSGLIVESVVAVARVEESNSGPWPAITCWSRFLRRRNTCYKIKIKQTNSQMALLG